MDTPHNPFGLEPVDATNADDLQPWRNVLGEAQAMTSALDYERAARMLEGFLASGLSQETGQTQGVLAVTQGLLGECLFQSGQAGRAVPAFEAALALCEQTGNIEGRAAYLGSLYETCRYLGDGERAATYATHLAALLDEYGNPADARHFRRQAGIVRRGEPLNRIVVEIDGARYELDDLPDDPGDQIQFFFERNRVTLRPAEVLTLGGRDYLAANQFAEALKEFEAAALADRLAPHPRYEAGLSLVLLGRYDEAVARYDETETLAPGWHSCRADRWLAARLADGGLPHEVFLVLRELEHSKLQAEYKADLAAQVLGSHPDVALLHLSRGMNLGKIGRVDDAVDAFRAGLQCDPEPDVRTRLLVECALCMESSDERRRLLVEAERLGGNLVAAAMATLALRYDT